MSDEQTQGIYERARLGQSVTLGTHPAVLVVDFSRGFGLKWSGLRRAGRAITQSPSPAP